jgi:acetolactate synthase-1/2/3 large subunit
MKPESPVTFAPETAADAWVGLLAMRGVDYLFANGGTDFAPVVEAYAKGEKLGWRLPEIVIVPHENMGIAMAHGYAMVTGRPQAMMVHVGVGTANTLNGLINASRTNPILHRGAHALTGPSGPGAQPHPLGAGALHRAVCRSSAGSRAAPPEQVETVPDRASRSVKSEPQGP